MKSSQAQAAESRRGSQQPEESESRRPEPPRRPAPVPAEGFLEEEDDENPLLSPEEIWELHKQQVQSAFLIGIAVGAAAVGSYFLVKWILNRAPEAIEEVAELAGEAASNLN